MRSTSLDPCPLLSVLSSIVYASMKKNLSDLSVKGPNTLIDRYDNIFKFKSYQEALVFHISKGYNYTKAS